MNSNLNNSFNVDVFCDDLLKIKTLKTETIGDVLIKNKFVIGFSYDEKHKELSFIPFKEDIKIVNLIYKQWEKIWQSKLTSLKIQKYTAWDVETELRFNAMKANDNVILFVFADQHLIKWENEEQKFDLGTNYKLIDKEHINILCSLGKLAEKVQLEITMNPAFPTIERFTLKEIKLKIAEMCGVDMIICECGSVSWQNEFRGDKCFYCATK
jgi:hypothetical protein